MIVEAASTFGDVLAARRRTAPGRTAFVFEGDGGAERMTYAELDERARAVAAAVRARAGAGARVVLLYPPGLDYVAALFGCFYAGVTAVPAYPPDPARLDRTLPRFVAILRDADAAAIATTGQIRAALGEILSGVEGAEAMPLVATDAPGDGAAPLAPSGADEVAILQYTSGSTAAPRGVLLTHRNLLANSDFIGRAFAQSGESCAVVWLPPYHDMGLVGGVLQPVYGGFPCVLMAPLAFLRRPLRWLTALSEHRATVSGGPNFAYDLCLRRVADDDLAALDLSSWELAFDGAEPVRAETIDAFSARFARCGFRRAAFYPCYGLAEATLMATGGSKLAGVSVRAVDGGRLAPGDAVADGARRIVGCGRPDRGHAVAIVDGGGAPLAERRVGEIWVRGPSVAAGYWRQPTATAETFDARLAGSGEGPFLRTGDLGFVLDGELFVTGRTKEVLVIDGRNHYPLDIELACERAVAGLRPGCGAAFEYEREGRSRIGVVYEVAAGEAGDPDATILAIRRAVGRAADAEVHAVVLVRPRTVPKTSSGKVQRRLCATLFERGELDAVAAWSLDGVTARGSGGR